MTNPNNVIGTNAAYGTRTSVNALNDLAQIVSGRGVVSGFAVVPKSGMTVKVGGTAGIRDVAVAEDNLGNRTMVNNRLATSVDVTIPAASVSTNRYDAIVVYVNNPATAADTTPDAPSVCGIIVASGGSTGVSDAQIRSAITADGGSGSIAYYAVVATVYVGAGTTTITSGNITASKVSLPAGYIEDSEIITRMIANNAVTTPKIPDGAITKAKIDWSTLTTGQTAVIDTPANQDYSVTVNIATQANANYKVILTLTGGVAAWHQVGYRVSAKTTTSFTIAFYGQYAATGLQFDYIIIPQ